MKQVFLNILDNAAKYGGDGKQIDIDLKRNGGNIVASVRDYGQGIPEAELPFVKEKFYKGSSKQRGSGHRPCRDGGNRFHARRYAGYRVRGRQGNDGYRHPAVRQVRGGARHYRCHSEGI